MTAGRTKWVLLLAGGLVLGFASWAAGIPDEVRIPIVRPHGEGDPPDAALFSHWLHDRYACYSCHPSIFPQAPKGFTHDDMDNGKYCATCHDGKRAFAVDDAECEDCHVPAR